MQKFKKWIFPEMQVMIMPMRMIKKLGYIDKIPTDKPTAQFGLYLDKKNFESTNSVDNNIINGNFYSYGKIIPGYETAETKVPPSFIVGRKKNIQTLSEVKKPHEKIIKINMITNSTSTGKKWSFVDKYKNIKNYYQITSVTYGAKHYFCIDLIIKKTVCLSTYEKTEPRCKPTTYGNLYFGKVAAKIILFGREKDLYEKITIN